MFGTRPITRETQVQGDEENIHFTVAKCALSEFKEVCTEGQTTDSADSSNASLHASFATEVTEVTDGLEEYKTAAMDEAVDALQAVYDSVVHVQHGSRDRKDWVEALPEGYGIIEIVAKSKARCFVTKNVVTLMRKSIAAYESELSVANGKGEFFEKTAVLTANTEKHEEVLHTARVSMITLELPRNRRHSKEAPSLIF